MRFSIFVSQSQFEPLAKTTTTQLSNGGILHINSIGDRSYFLNNVFHREDGPAVEFANGDKYWFINGKCHREDGPAVIYSSGHKEWFLNGKYIPCKTQKQFEQLMKLKAFW
jgi:hypothetical protein